MTDPEGRLGDKRYDRDYFDKWYRDPRHRVTRPSDVERKVAMVVSMAEFLLGRPLKSVLDIGCGEGAWQPILHRLRPTTRYAGVDSSEYVVRRFGALRNIRMGTFGALDRVGLAASYDLVVCCDVLHYVPTADLRAGLATLGDLVGGLAYLEAYTQADDIDGDLGGFARRSARTYRRLFAEAGLQPVGLQCYVPEEGEARLTALERVHPGQSR